MKRGPELAPLSREHHVALEVALALRRATPANLAATVDRYLTFFNGDGDAHFAVEEEVLVSALPDALALRLVDEHAAIRRATHELAAHATREAAARLGEQLAAHVRFEEREAFPLLERTLSPAELARIAERLRDSPDP